MSDAMTRSCERLNIEASRSKSIESALEVFQNPINGGHHLVIVDGRCKNIDVESFGRFVHVKLVIGSISIFLTLQTDRYATQKAASIRRWSLL